jgi:hypothetical protein
MSRRVNRSVHNGLCGAAVPGSLFLMTGLHTGHVDFRVELHGAEPPIEAAYEEIVEVPFRPLSEDVSLVEWSAQASYPLALEVTDYRVRYCARGMDAGKDADTILEDEPAVDSYLLQFWPAPPAREGIVKQTGQTAAYCHALWQVTPEVEGR